MFSLVLLLNWVCIITVKLTLEGNSASYSVEDLSWCDPRVLSFGSDVGGADEGGGAEGGADEGGGAEGGDDSVWIASLDLGHVAAADVEREALLLLARVREGEGEGERRGEGVRERERECECVCVYVCVDDMMWIALLN